MENGRNFIYSISFILALFLCPFTRSYNFSILYLYCRVVTFVDYYSVVLCVGRLGKERECERLCTKSNIILMNLGKVHTHRVWRFKMYTSLTFSDIFFHFLISFMAMAREIALDARLGILSKVGTRVLFCSKTFLPVCKVTKSTNK